MAGDEFGDEFEGTQPLLGISQDELENYPVFPLIHRIRHLVIKNIDTTLSWEQLQQPSVNFSIVRPLTRQLLMPNRPPPLLYCLLLNRVHFLHSATLDIAFAGVNQTRSSLCELLCIKLLSGYTTLPMELVTVLTTYFNPFQGINKDMFDDDINDGDKPSEEEIKKMKEDGERENANALEVAIHTGAKKLIKTPLLQQVVEAIYNGEVMYIPAGTHSVVQDNYKQRPAHAYDVRSRPILDHYRLRVPKIRAFLEFSNFAVILVLFLITQSTMDVDRFTFWECLFIFFVCGFALDELAQANSGGLAAYFDNMWNFFDCAFVLIFLVYVSIRLYSIPTVLSPIHSPDHALLSFDILALGACVLFPRLAGSLLQNNVIILGLRAMARDFFVFMCLAAVCASGFLFSFWVLARGSWDLGRIAWLMLEIWFGNNFIGFDRASNLHKVFGPLVFICYAMLANTLLLTILISLLSNTFAIVQQNSYEEFLHQRAIRTIERVKGDALYSYQPPMNLVAFAILVPLRPICNPRWFHKINVMLIRFLNFPILLGITVYERLKTQRFGLQALISRGNIVGRAGSRIFGSLHKGVVSWEGGIEGSEKVFEREVTARALKAARKAAQGKPHHHQHRRRSDHHHHQPEGVTSNGKSHPSHHHHHHHPHPHHPPQPDDSSALNSSSDSELEDLDPNINDDPAAKGSLLGIASVIQAEKQKNFSERKGSRFSSVASPLARMFSINRRTSTADSSSSSTSAISSAVSDATSTSSASTVRPRRSMSDAGGALSSTGAGHAGATSGFQSNLPTLPDEPSPTATPISAGSGFISTGGGNGGGYSTMDVRLEKLERSQERMEKMLQQAVKTLLSLKNPEDDDDDVGGFTSGGGDEVDVEREKKQERKSRDDDDGDDDTDLMSL